MRGAAVFAAVLAVACTTEAPPTGTSDSSQKPVSKEPVVPVPTGPLASLLIVSDPGPALGGAALGATVNASVGTVVFVSLPPATLPAPTTVRIINTRTAEVVTPTLINGGFDPVAIPALAGDTLDVQVTQESGEVSHTLVMALKTRPPRIVRTSPPQGQTDVPLNAVIVIVVSEPIDPATANGNGVRLRLDTETVPGSLELDPSGMLLRFTPAVPLLPDTMYRLEITPALTDRSGMPLAAASTVNFTTTAQTSGPEPEPRFWVNPWESRVRQGDSIKVWTWLEGRPPESYQVTWKSSNPAQVTVSADSLNMATVAALAPGGPVFITATIEGRSVSVTVFVVPPAPVPVGLIFAAVSPGSSHTCAVTTSGVMYCWGDGRFGELGDGLNASSAIPVRVAGGVAYTQVSVGTYTCGLTQGGDAYCWPDNIGGFPIASIAFGMISSAALHTCGVSMGGSAYCWGGGGYGELGIGRAASTSGCWPAAPGQPLWCSSAPMLVAGGHRFAQVAAGGYFSCGIDGSGTAYCWGDNRWGALGLGTAVGPEACVGGVNDDYIVPWEPAVIPCSTVPVPAAAGLVLREVEALWGSACGLTIAGQAYCWGANESGQLGAGTTSGPEQCVIEFRDGSTRLDPCSSTPVAVAGGLTFAHISGGSVHSCGVTADGSAYCWGQNEYGQLGDGTTVSRASPVPVAGGLHFVSVVAGEGASTCGISTAGILYCWGGNGDGQLGTGTRVGSAVPMRVVGQ